MLFFFQAEDGIRDLYVTGVQTCALPISLVLACDPLHHPATTQRHVDFTIDHPRLIQAIELCINNRAATNRSEERRVGKECRYRWWPAHDIEHNMITMRTGMR